VFVLLANAGKIINKDRQKILMDSTKPALSEVEWAHHKKLQFWFFEHAFDLSPGKIFC